MSNMHVGKTIPTSHMKWWTEPTVTTQEWNPGFTMDSPMEMSAQCYQQSKEKRQQIKREESLGKKETYELHAWAAWMGTACSWTFPIVTQGLLKPNWNHVRYKQTKLILLPNKRSCGCHESTLAQGQRRISSQKKNLFMLTVYREITPGTKSLSWKQLEPGKH